MEKRGSKKDIGQALLKKLQSSSSQEKGVDAERNLPSPKHDIGSIWHNQSRIKRIEAARKPQHSRKRGVLYKDFVTRLFDKLPKIRLPKVTRKRLIATGTTLLIVLFANLQTGGQTDNSAPETTEVKGQSTTPELPAANGAEDELLFPAGKGPTDYDIRVNSPPSNASPSYVYSDKLNDANGTQLLVTQQKVESNFNLKEIAGSFQATNTISVDGNLIYHGLNERTGVQSLMFIKDEWLVLIRSPYKLSDETWASYYLGLQG